jgi:hypothetical protein
MYRLASHLILTILLLPGWACSGGGGHAGRSDAGPVFKSDATTDGCTGTSLSPGQSCVVGVRFVPTSSGSKASTFTVRNVASWVATAVLTGTATTGSY